MSTVSLWIGFNLFVLLLLALDLGLFHRRSHVVSIREATVWSVVWVALALLFAGGLRLTMGPTPALEFLTGYLIEKSLSVDNLFIFALLFGYFGVPAAYQHRVLFWGILGALATRAAFILAGSTLLAQFHWMIYVFGGFLVLTGIRMGLVGEIEVHPEKNPLLRLARRVLPTTDGFREGRFFARENGRWAVTPLFLVLLLVESTDVVFAVDSIPAIFAVTLDPFIVYTSNVFAILGLRSLYFVLAGAMRSLPHLKLGLAAVLVFVGAKMVLADVYKVPIGISLAVVATLIGASVAASLWRRPASGVEALPPGKAGGAAPDPPARG
jgi:tellurite resistance protein TerC